MRDFSTGHDSVRYFSHGHDNMRNFHLDMIMCVVFTWI